MSARGATKNTSLYVIFFTSVLFLASMSDRATGRSLETIIASGVLHYCVFPIAEDVGHVEPEGCLGENCTFDGPVRILTEAFAETLGVTTSYYVPTWDEQFQNSEGETIREASYTPHLMATGKCDVYPSNLIRRDWRMKKLRQITVFPSRDVVIIDQSKRDDIRSFEDLAGRTAALVESSAQHSWMDEQNATVFVNDPLTITFVPSVNDEFHAIVAGEAEIGVVPAYTAYPALRAEFPTLVAAFPVGPITEHTWAFRKDAAQLHEAFQAWITDQQANSNSVFNQMFSEQYGVPYATHLRLVARIK